METHVYVLHALAPLHCGTGQGEGLIDLPIARERASEHPILPGSSVKGVLRDAARRNIADSKIINGLFGPERSADRVNRENDYAGALRFSDARLLLFPVTSDTGTFAWVTCPWVLARLLRDAAPAKSLSAPDVPPNHALVAPGSRLVRNQGAVIGGLRHSAGALPKAWCDLLGKLVSDSKDWQTLVTERLAVVSDDTFTWLVRNRTDVRAHIAINPETGTVTDGALWYEESLPAESVLVGVLQLEPNSKTGFSSKEGIERVGALLSGPLQFGGNATTGMGVATFRLVGGVG